MLISHRKRFVILAPWKTASTTVRARLGQYDESPYSPFYEFNATLKRVVHQHLTYADFLALPESRLGYTVAAFVRNPYDRVFSGFQQLQRDLQAQPQALFPDAGVRRLVMAQLRDNLGQLLDAGYDFERWVGMIRDEQVVETGRNSSFPLHPNHYWTHHNGRRVVDFIGRVESFEADFARLCELLDVGPSERVNENVGASREQMEGFAHGYRYAEQMSSAVRRRIEELFDADFELFGYVRLD